MPYRFAFPHGFGSAQRSRPGALLPLVVLALAAGLVVASAGCTDADASQTPTPTAAAATAQQRAAATAAPAMTATASPAATAAAATATTPGSVRPGPRPAPAGPPPATEPYPFRLFFPEVASGGKSVVPLAAAATPTAVPTSTPVPTASPTAVASPTPAPTGPTATPVPPATPTPRVKPPPSPYRRLQDYPRPPGDSGYGFHINAAPQLPSKQVLQSQVIPLLKALGATWVTVWISSDFDDQAEGVRLLVDSGFEVIVRYHDINPPHAGYVPSVEGLRKLRAAGAHYFVTGNEPNLSLENPARAAPDLIAQQWVRSADRIKSVGGIPLLYPMSPGGSGDIADSRTMLAGILEWLKANDALDTLDGAGVAIHNRPMGKPLEVRDSTSFLEYEWIDDTVARYAGKHIPLFGTEAGYAFGEQVLPQYPRIDGELHKQYNLAIITGFRDGRWRHSLFTQTFWLLGGFGYQQFIGDWWVANPLNYGKDLPIVDALKGLPRFTREFSAPGFQTAPRP